METFGFAAAIAVGLTLLWSGVSKLLDPARFVLAVLEYRIGPRWMGPVAGRLIPLAEVACAATLLAGLSPRVSGVVTGLLFVAFGLAVSTNLARGRKIDCHCFGLDRSEPIGAITLVHLAVLLCMSVFVAASGDLLFRSPPPDVIPALLLGASLVLGLYLLQAVPPQWRVWRTRVAPGTRLFGSCVSYRHHNDGRRTEHDLPIGPALVPAENAGGRT